MIGRGIRHYRQERGLSLKDVAAQCDCTFNTISRYERGKRSPSENMIHCIADALGVSVEQLRDKGRELEAGELVRQQAERQPGPGDYVSSAEDVSRWRDKVVRDQTLDQWEQMILMALPAFLDRQSWVVPITEGEFIEQTGRSREVVEEHFASAIASAYVERLGRVEWALRLVFPGSEIGGGRG